MSDTQPLSLLRLKSGAVPSLALMLLLALGCSGSDAAVESEADAAQPAASPAPVPDEPVAEHRTALLDLAFEAVTKMPVMPHVKDRSRDQEQVVAACLEMGQPQRAERYIGSIENWRRGTAYADLAYYCAEQGATGAAQRFLELAQAVAAMPDSSLPDVESPQSWRRDRIRAGIARTRLRLGQPEEAAKFSADLAALEQGDVDAVRAMSADGAACDEQVEALGRVVEAGTFEDIEGGLKSAVEYYDRFYSDAERRARLQEGIEDATAKVPRQFRIETLLDLAGLARKHEDQETAAALLQAARTTFDEAKWDFDDRAPLVVRLVALRYALGDTEGARGELDEALARFEQDKGPLDSIRQAKAIRSLAEGYSTIQAPSDALDLYGKAVELGAQNPNARPRAEQLAATCCSMARHDVKPEPGLWSRMHAISEGLDSPW